MVWWWSYKFRSFETCCTSSSSLNERRFLGFPGLGVRLIDDVALRALPKRIDDLIIKRKFWWKHRTVWFSNIFTTNRFKFLTLKAHMYKFLKREGRRRCIPRSVDRDIRARLDIVRTNNFFDIRLIWIKNISIWKQKNDETTWWQNV